MQRRKVTAIRTETLERWVIRGHAEKVVDCGVCGGDVWLSISEACRAGGFTPIEICGFAERGTIHSSLTGEGHLLICGSSLGITILKGEQKNEI